MQQHDFNDVVSLKQGPRGWNDFGWPLVGSDGTAVDGTAAGALHVSRLARSKDGRAIKWKSLV